MRIFMAAITTALLATSNFALAHDHRHDHKHDKHRIEHHHKEKHRGGKHHNHYREVCRHKSHDLTRRHTVISSGLLAPIAIHHALHGHHIKVKTSVMSAHHKHVNRHDHRAKDRHRH